MNEKIKNYNKARKFSLNWGADLFGVAGIPGIKGEFNPLSRIPRSAPVDEWRMGAPPCEGRTEITNGQCPWGSSISGGVTGKLGSAVCLGVRVSGSILDEIGTYPTKLYFQHYRVINGFLDQLALRLANFIQGLGYSALPVPASQIVDWQKQTAHLSHKKIGRLAGLGWIGRNNLLVNKELGSQFRLATVLTSLPLKHDRPVKEDCGNCRLCMVRCPAKAIKERPEDFGHQDCFALLKGFQKQGIVNQYICGICVKACKGKNG